MARGTPAAVARAASISALAAMRPMTDSTYGGLTVHFPPSSARGAPKNVPMLPNGKSVSAKSEQNQVSLSPKSTIRLLKGLAKPS